MTYSPALQHVLSDQLHDVMQYFAYSHLSPALQEVSEPFARLAQLQVHNIALCPQLLVALHKLLEAKDAAVRAALSPAGLE